MEDGVMRVAIMTETSHLAGTAAVSGQHSDDGQLGRRARCTVYRNDPVYIKVRGARRDKRLSKRGLERELQKKGPREPSIGDQHLLIA
jgi:hypothetical protein